LVHRSLAPLGVAQMSLRLLSLACGPAL